MRRNGREIDVREGDVLLQSVERHQPLGPDPVALQGATIDDAGVHDVRSGESIDEEIHVLVIDNDEARNSKSSGRQTRRPRSGHHEIRLSRLLVEEPNELSRPLRETVELSRNALAEARADRFEGGSLAAEDGERVAVCAGREDNIVACFLESPYKRKQVSHLRWIVDVDPDPHGPSASSARE